MRLRFAAVVALLAALAAGAAVTAWANPPAYDTVVTIHEHATGQYKGRVKSDKHRCVAHRPLKMYRRTPGPDDLVANFEADADGTWSYFFVGEHYYVVAKREHFTTGGQNFICRRDRSPTT
jgi:hypothetical protein